MPMVNIVSGGAHAAGMLDIQDVLVIPEGAASFSQALEWASRVRHAAAELLHKRGGTASLVADEGGLAAHLEANETALSLVTDGIARAGFRPGVDVSLAIDIAANQLWSGNSYMLRVDGIELKPEAWLELLSEWCNRYPIRSIEDAFFEDDWHSWSNCSTAIGFGRQLIGDDLFATNSERLDRGIADGVANSVLVKPNQAGTLTRAKSVILQAKRAGYGTIVSARSGDTEDTWLADLAVGWRSGQIKVGSTMRSERTAKWNRLLEIESKAAGSGVFAGREAISAG
jgi:enolase